MEGAETTHGNSLANYCLGQDLAGIFFKQKFCFRCLRLSFQRNRWVIMAYLLENELRKYCDCSIRSKGVGAGEGWWGV